ncbi:MAG: hypothetical protein DRI52_01445 [Chloroflexi bacterium]|nr:hypothetical protein [Anaerolineae bacterium]RLC73678.1 MAG: hypothetical protein DRI52_01445 [Chloroflexota bacterium]
MKSRTEIRLDNIRLPTNLLGGRMRFVVLILVFNVLLISTLLLSLQQGELKREVITLQATRMVYEELIRTETITHTQVITRIIPYGSQP